MCKSRKKKGKRENISKIGNEYIIELNTLVINTDICNIICITNFFGLFFIKVFLLWYIKVLLS